MPCLIRDFVTDRLVGQVIIQVADGSVESVEVAPTGNLSKRT